MVINDTDAGIFSSFCHFCLSQASWSRVQFCAYASRDLPASSRFILNSLMRYSRDGFTSPCHIFCTEDADGVNPRVFIKLKCGCTLDTSPKYIQHVADPDVASVPSTTSEFRKELASLSDQDLSFLAGVVAVAQSVEPFVTFWYDSVGPCWSFSQKVSLISKFGAILCLLCFWKGSLSSMAL